MRIIEKSKEVEIYLIENWKNNARAIQKKDFERLKEQIQGLGIYKPMVCYEENGKYVVLGGNMRLRAIKELGHKMGWITVVEPKDEEEKLRINLSDNDRAGFYQDEEFAKVMFDFKGSDWADYKIDFAEPQGDVDEFNREYFDDLNQGNIDDDDTPPIPEEAKTKTGELWLLGEHRLLIGDATREADVGRLMGGERADMVFTDPPYGVDYSSKNEFLNKVDKGNRIQTPIENDNIEDYIKFFSDFLSVIQFADYNSFYITISDQKLLDLLISIKNLDYKMSQILVWSKNNHVLGRQDYFNKHELIVYGWKEHHRFYGKNDFTIWNIDRPHKSELHPTMKPIELIIKAVRNSSEKGMIVYDGFLGSGSTLIGCEKTDRKCYGMEIEPIYGDVTIQRYVDFTGKDPIREDGVKWSELNVN